MILLGKRDSDDDATTAAQVYKDIFQADVHCIPYPTTPAERPIYGALCLGVPVGTNEYISAQLELKQ